MQIICPECNQACEVDEEPAAGQHLQCPFCSEIFPYSGSGASDGDGDGGTGYVKPAAPTGGLRIVSAPERHAQRKKAKDANLSPLDVANRMMNNRIAKIMSGGRKAIAAQVIKAWWFFGNIFLSVLFLYPLSTNPYATPGAVISIILGWVFALWTLWIVYTIAMGVSELVSGRQSDEER